jgi:hypothetical protein
MGAGLATGSGWERKENGKKGGGVKRIREGLKGDGRGERRERFFIIIKIIYWVATMLPKHGALK